VQHGDLFNIERSADSTDLTDMVCASFNWNNSDVFVLDIQKILERITGELV
jgi:hypothetical protein